MIDATYLKARRTATCLRSKGGPEDQSSRLIGRTKGDMNAKLHAITDFDRRPIRFFMAAGQACDYLRAAALPGDLPKAEWLLADPGHFADWFREALKDRGIKPRIHGGKSRCKPIEHDERRYNRPNRIETMFVLFEDRRRVVTCCDGCPKVSSGGADLPSPSPQASCSGYERE